MNASNTIRLNIIEFLFKVEDDKILETIYQQMTETVENEVYTKSTDDDILAIAKEPIPDYISSAQIEAEQGGFSMDEFGIALDELDRDLYKDETLEEMLNALT
jgi:hypothetical protein